MNDLNVSKTHIMIMADDYTVDSFHLDHIINIIGKLKTDRETALRLVRDSTVDHELTLVSPLSKGSLKITLAYSSGIKAKRIMKALYDAFECLIPPICENSPTPEFNSAWVDYISMHRLRSDSLQSLPKPDIVFGQTQEGLLNYIACKYFKSPIIQTAFIYVTPIGDNYIGTSEKEILNLGKSKVIKKMMVSNNMNTIIKGSPYIIPNDNE